VNKCDKRRIFRAKVGKGGQLCDEEDYLHGRQKMENGSTRT